MSKYFNTNDYDQLRIVDVGGGDEPEGNGWSVIRGGYEDKKGRVQQGNLLAHCETRAEAENFVSQLLAIN